MANFVLVHAAWRGGWTWKRVARQLRAAGHEVMLDKPKEVADLLQEAAALAHSI